MCILGSNNFWSGLNIRQSNKKNTDTKRYTGKHLERLKLNFIKVSPTLLSRQVFTRLVRDWNTLVSEHCLTLSSPNLPLSSSSTTSRELLSQFSTCSGWRWFDVVWKLKKIAMYWWNSFMEIFILEPSVVRKLTLFSGMWKYALMHR